MSKGFYIMNASTNTKKKNKRSSGISLYEKHRGNGIAYEALHQEWERTNDKLQILLKQSTCNDSVVAFIKECYNTEHLDRNENIIPSATLLTGVNQPDHSELFSALSNKLRSHVTPHVATIYSADATSHKTLVEHVVDAFINGSATENSDSELGDEMENDIKLKKTRCTMAVLKCWYTNKHGKNKTEFQSPTKKHKNGKKRNQLVIILPDFEGFNPEVLQDFILNLSFYTRYLPIVLVFGVATSASALHKTFPYQVSSKLLIQVFPSQSSADRINQVLENVFLTYDCSFHLSGNAFQLLTDIFLFYDFSVMAFVQGFKSCMMEHYFDRNLTSLCCRREDINRAIDRLKTEDIEAIRHLPSFRSYVEMDTCENRIALIDDDHFLKKRLVIALEEIHTYLFSFHSILWVLLILVQDLPKQPLGKQLRELYLTATSTTITNTKEYNDCISMLSFQSKSELCDKLRLICAYLDDEIREYTDSRIESKPESPRKKNSKKKSLGEQNSSTNAIKSTIHILKSFLERLENSSLTTLVGEDMDIENEPSVMNRQKLKEKLLDAMKNDKNEKSEFECVKADLIQYLNDYVFKPFLKMPSSVPFYEIFFFTDISKIKKQIVGTPWASIHNALNNPVTYLQCKCCELPRPDSITPTLPDLSIVYKLHLECGKLINLYDWLQAFVCIVDPATEDNEEDREQRLVKPEYHARFTKAVLELQLLGFIKPSKMKTDHVTRLTW